jgi:hypothetical protein
LHSIYPDIKIIQLMRYLRLRVVFVLLSPLLFLLKDVSQIEYMEM